MRAGVDLIVVNYRTPADLGQFIRSYEQHPPALEHDLFIVNVSPGDADLDLGERITGRHPQVHHLFTRENVGYARACNATAARGDREVILLLNADTALTDGAVDRCATELLANEEWGVLGPRQIDSRGRLTHAGIIGAPEAPHIRYWLHRDRGQANDIIDTAVTVSGSVYFIRRQVWDELTECPIYREVAPDAMGAFLPTQHYFEETWCSYHAQAHDWRCVYFGEAVVRHEWHRASPHDGHADKQFKVSREFFRRACDAHGITHD